MVEFYFLSKQHIRVVLFTLGSSSARCNTSKIYLTTSLTGMATISPCLENSLGCWIPHHQSDSWQPHGVCLIVGDEGNGTVSGVVLCPLGGPGWPYF